jgi:predicted MFS family arabinose efflux permease
MLRNLGEGLAYVLRTPVILGVLAITAVMNLLAFPYQHMVPVVAKQVLGLGPQLTGLLLAADGLGAFSGSLFVASLREVKRKGRLFVVGAVLLMGAVLLFSLSPWYLLSFGVLFMAGAGTACFATMQSSLILTSASDAMRGRAMGTLMLAIGFGPLGALQVGALASALGAPLAMTVSAGSGIVLLAVIVWKAAALWRITPSHS